MKDVFHSFLVAAVLFGGTLAFSQMPDYSPLFSSDAEPRVESLERRVARLERELRALQASVRPSPAAALKPSLSSGGYPWNAISAPLSPLLAWPVLPRPGRIPGSSRTSATWCPSPPYAAPVP